MKQYTEKELITLGLNVKFMCSGRKCENCIFCKKLDSICNIAYQKYMEHINSLRKEVF
jgi:hypothetical protein